MVQRQFGSHSYYDSKWTHRIEQQETHAGASDDRLSVYYSDQRDPKHGQKLVQQTTEGDLDSWEDPVDVVASDTYEDRPGMLVVTKVCSCLYTCIPLVYSHLLAPQRPILHGF